MSKIKELDRGLRAAEFINLSLLAICLALPFALIFREDGMTAALLWAFGVVIPVHGIRFVCEWQKKTLGRILYSLAIIALAILIPPTPMRRVYYGICCAPIFITGALLQRPQGKIIFTVPKFYFPAAGLIVYAFGKVSMIPILSVLATVLAVLLVLVFVLYKNQTRLIKNLHENQDGRVSVPGIISLNRKLMLAFVLLSALVITAIPLLTRYEAEQTVADPFQYGEPDWHAEVPPTEEIIEGTPKGPVPGDKDWNFGVVDQTVTVLFIVLIVVTVGLVTWIVIKMLRGIGSRAGKHREIQSESFVIEKLTEQKQQAAAPEPEPSGYAKKIRKTFSKLILRRTEDHGGLAPKTPVELGAAAELPASESAETVLSLYEKARYSPDEVTKEDYRAMKEAAHLLESHPIRQA